MFRPRFLLISMQHYLRSTIDTMSQLTAMTMTPTMHEEYTGAIYLANAERLYEKIAPKINEVQMNNFSTTTKLVEGKESNGFVQ